ncbi:uncharacterized protein DEA37_0000442 [Paragonimus westermani]|uniref:C3H1-type domain-containing protein n=1 Tax=Paragonimus westermani TaxID=34504 RepID=A0A5J4NNU8_9TREM|nr:uncharacterized protein DEA37_0000442 [Paragonimus westermani]
MISIRLTAHCPFQPQKSSRPMKTEDMLFNVRYKTQPCRHYEQSGGFCLAGEDCHFAHGKAELRDPQNHPKFRTRMCRNFAENGSCNFGTRCFFKHVKEQKSIDIGKQIVTVEVHQSPMNNNEVE